jgi:hypothetical protein
VVRSRWLLLVCGCSVLAGCGNARTAPPDLSRALPPGGFARQAFPAAGVRLRAPTDWQVQPGNPPLVVSVRSGLAAVAVWRYPRTQALPATSAQLGTALRRLVAMVRSRDATFLLGSAAVVTVGHRRAIQLRGLETIDGQRREVRSTHLYAYGSEVVVDAFAPPPEFRTVDKRVFHPLLRGLRLGPPAP